MDLIQRAKQGLLSRQELDRIAHELEHQTTFEHVDTQIAVISITEDPRYARAVERYLEFRQDPFTVGRALATLCHNFDLIEEYFDWLLAFAAGVDWDVTWGIREVRRTALHHAGYHLAQYRSRELLSLLIRIAEDETERQTPRGEALTALATSAAPFPHYVGCLEIDDPRCTAIIEQARARLASEPDGPPREKRRPVRTRFELPPALEPYLPADALRSRLVERARRGDLRVGVDLDRLAGELAKPRPPEEIRELLLALMFAGGGRQRLAVDACLGHPDVGVAGLALLVLCSGWRLANDYVERLAGHIEHGPPAIREIAFRIAGTHLLFRRSRRLLELLLRTAQDPHEAQLKRIDAAIALTLASGEPPGPVAARADFNEADFAHALELGRERLLTE